jgi:hypothetical protein
LIKAFALAAAKNLQSALVPKKANNFFVNYVRAGPFMKGLGLVQSEYAKPL